MRITFELKCKLFAINCPYRLQFGHHIFYSDRYMVYCSISDIWRVEVFPDLHRSYYSHPLCSDC